MRAATRLIRFCGGPHDGRFVEMGYHAGHRDGLPDTVQVPLRRRVTAREMYGADLTGAADAWDVETYRLQRWVSERGVISYRYVAASAGAF